MKDYKLLLATELYDILSGITETYSIIPMDTERPYIYFGDFETIYQPLKDDFRQTINFNVIYSESFQNSTSLLDHFKKVGEIKNALKPSKDFTLNLYPDFKQVYFKMQAESSSEFQTKKSRIYQTLLQYEFEIGSAEVYEIFLTFSESSQYTSCALFPDNKYYALKPYSQLKVGDAVYYDEKLSQPLHNGYYSDRSSFIHIQDDLILEKEDCAEIFSTFVSYSDSTAPCSIIPTIYVYTIRRFSSLEIGDTIYQDANLITFYPGYYSDGNVWYHQNYLGKIIENGSCAVAHSHDLGFDKKFKELACLADFITYYSEFEFLDIGATLYKDELLHIPVGNGYYSNRERVFESLEGILVRFWICG